MTDLAARNHASIGPDVAPEPAACTSGACGVPSAGAAIRRGVRGFAGKAILEIGFDEMDLTRKATALGTPYLCRRVRDRGGGRLAALGGAAVAEDLNWWCGGATAPFDAAISHGAFARVARLRHLLEVVRQPEGLLVFSVPYALGPGDPGAPSDGTIPRTPAEYHAAITEAGFTVEEMTDAAGGVVFSARCR